MNWIKIDPKIHFNRHLVLQDECYYFLEYTPGGYSISKSNSMIINFKKELKHRSDEKVWGFRNKEIKNFAQMIHDRLKGFCCTIIPCATSKPRKDHDFNDRLDALAKELKKLSNNYDIQFCLDTISPQKSSHTGGTRNPDEIKEFTSWIKPTKEPQEYIILIDDVFTTGAHFRAYKDMVLLHYPEHKVIGIFLARYDGSSLYDIPPISEMDLDNIDF